MKRLWQELLRLGFVCYALVAAASFLGRLYWPFELMSHFRPMLAASGVIFALLCLTHRPKALAAASLVIAAVQAAPLEPYLVPPELLATARAGSEPHLRVLTANLHHGWADRGALRRAIENERPDIVVLTEIMPDWVPLLDELGAAYPHRIAGLVGGDFNIAVLSRVALQDGALDTSLGLPIARARLCLAEASCVRIVALHAPPPIYAAPQRKALLARAADLAAAEPEGRAIVVGDLNCTPWSPVFADLLDAGGLRDSARGRGLVSTWNSRFPLLGLPIDHVLVGSGLVVHARRVGPDIGSDHFPVVADLAFAR
jgi:endonuclease/exonuclease/phosphatase (EEP) superfamily protein YafD